MGASTYQKGRFYEEQAFRLLLSRGYRILKRNYRLGHVDIDIIAMDPDGVLVFVEVKYRRRGGPEHPLEAVISPAKQRNISRAAAVYLGSCGMGPSVRCRFDVIAFYGDESIHIRDAFTGSVF